MIEIFNMIVIACLCALFGGAVHAALDIYFGIQSPFIGMVVTGMLGISAGKKFEKMEQLEREAREARDSRI